MKENSELESDNAGVYRSNVFPGFWIDGTALWQQDYDRLMDTLAIGMKTPEYRQFSSDLAQRTGK